jgi:hypothetical protein
MEGSTPSSTKEETANNGVRAGDIGTLTILGTFAPTNWKTRMMVKILDRLTPY